MNYLEKKIYEDKQSVYYDLMKKVFKFSKKDHLESGFKIKEFFNKLIFKFKKDICPELLRMLLELLVQNVTESSDAKSINLLKLFVGSSGAIQFETELNDFNNLIRSKGFKKISSMFEPTCLMDEFLYYKINSKIKPKFKQKTRKALKIINKIYKERGKLFLYEKLLVQFPDYLNLSYKTFKFLMLKEGYLHISWRFYLAIMAVSNSKCNYLLRCLEELFLFYGGDKAWLIQGLRAIPEKLQNISKLNQIMANKPIKLQNSDLIDLLENKNLYHCWTINEIVHASAIIFHFQKLASFSNCLDIDIPFYFLSGDNFITLHAPKNFRYSKETDEFVKHYALDISNYRIENERSSDEIMSYYEFNWNDNAYDILSEIYPEGIRRIDQELHLFINFKKRKTEDLFDKEEYRRCITCYTERLMGYDNDDYDYSNINKCLSISQREFIKNIVFQPNIITRNEIEEMKLIFNSSEIMELILMTLNLKNRLQLTILSSVIKQVRINKYD